MERVVFLVEQTGERITCLLNPESVVMRRTAGVKPHALPTGAVTGVALSDDPLVATGGGVTELELDLLFDAEIERESAAPTRQIAGELDAAPESQPEIDVRDLTRPIWSLAENAEGADGYGAPPLIRLIWGRSWNLPGVIVAIAERLERFTSNGVPQRSWLRVRLRRVSESLGRTAPRRPATPQFELPVLDDPMLLDTAPYVDMLVDDLGLPAQRLDQIAAERYGDPSLWRLIASLNNIDHPLRLSEGMSVVLPAIYKA